MDIPLPDFSDDDDVFTPPTTPFHHTAPVRCLKESISHHELFSLAQSCDPATTFCSKTITGLEYDSDNPIYKTKTCILFIARKGAFYFALKTSPSYKLLHHEWEVYNQIGKFPTIIDAIGFWKEKNNTHFLQLDFAFGGSIANTVHYYDKHDAWRILAHISSALWHIHSKGYIHLDVSPANILQCSGFNSRAVFKLTDFGTVLRNGNFDSFCEGAGPYVSPEALYWPNTQYPVSYSADIWSFGAVMFEVITHQKIPREAEKYDAIRNGTFDLSCIPEEFAVVRQMLKVDPNQRPTAEYLTSLPKVKDILQSLSVDAVQPRPVHWLEPRVFAEEEVKRRTSFDGI